MSTLNEPLHLSWHNLGSPASYFYVYVYMYACMYACTYGCMYVCQCLLIFSRRVNLTSDVIIDDAATFDHVWLDNAVCYPTFLVFMTNQRETSTSINIFTATEFNTTPWNTNNRAPIWYQIHLSNLHMTCSFATE